MARTRQKRKAKRREEQLKATRRSAGAKEQPMNPAEQAVIDQAEALEVADELEEQLEERTVVEAQPEAPVEARPERVPREPRRKEAKQPQRRREQKPDRR